jgi:hypothetical protein
LGGEKEESSGMIQKGRIRRALVVRAFCLAKLLSHNTVTTNNINAKGAKERFRPSCVSHLGFMICWEMAPMPMLLSDLEMLFFKNSGLILVLDFAI